MLNYLQKYNNLPQELRDKMSAPKAMSAIEDLEKKHELNLAAVIMKIMIKEIDVNNLIVDLANEFSVNKKKAEQLSSDLKKKVLFRVADYLGIKKEQTDRKPIPAPIKTKDRKDEKKEDFIRADDPLFSLEDEEEIKSLAKKINGDIQKVKLSDKQIESGIDGAVAEARINFGSDLLAERFRQILKTYFRGIRDRISAKQALTKSMELGGLGFDNDSAEKALKIADLKIKELNKFHPADVQPERIKTADTEQEKTASLKDSGVRDVDYDLSALKKPEGMETDNVKKLAKAKKIADKTDAEHEPASANPPAGRAGASEGQGLPPLKQEQGKLAPPPPAIRQDEPRAEEPPFASSFANPPAGRTGATADKKAMDGKIEVFQKPEKKLFLSKIKNVLAKKAPNEVIIEKAGAFAAKQKDINPKLKIIKEKATVRNIAEEQVHKIKQIDARQVDEAMGKIKMDDVKFTPKSMGPVDELKYMDLVSFRRLCKTPEDIINKIKEKINLLEEESYAKRLNGIKAWRKNQVNKVYLEIGHESINEKKPINAIIEDRKATGKDYLNAQEFEAITDLNKDLRF